MTGRSIALGLIGAAIFVTWIVGFGILHSQPTAVLTLDDGRTAYVLQSWLGAMFWPISTVLFVLLVVVWRMVADFNVSWKVLVAVAFAAVAISIGVTELAGVSPFRRFYSVVFSSDAVQLRSGLWRRSVQIPEIADVSVEVREYDGKREYRYPTLVIRDVDGHQWRSIDVQFLEGEAELDHYTRLLASAGEAIKSRLAGSATD